MSEPPVSHRLLIDPIQAIAVARNAQSFTDTAHQLKVSESTLRKVMRELGMFPALKRLYRWRWRKRHVKWTHSTLLQYLRDRAKALGHTPSVREIKADPNGPPATLFYASVMRHATRRRSMPGFKTLKTAVAEAGLEPRGPGAPKGTHHLCPIHSMLLAKCRHLHQESHARAKKGRNVRSNRSKGVSNS